MIGQLGLGVGLAALALSAVAGGTGAGDCADWPEATARLRLQIDGVRNAKGRINITIYPDDAAHFLDGKYKLGRFAIAAAPPASTACVALPGAGRYAIALFHDENGNGHLDTNLIGFPVEGYGFTNNPTLHFGPPALAQVRIAVENGDNPQVVRLHY